MRFPYFLMALMLVTSVIDAKTVTKKDSNGNPTTYTYSDDDKHLLLNIVYPAVLDENGNAVNPTFTYQYDAQGQLIASIDPKGYITQILRDANGHPIETMHPDGSTERMVYDKDQLIESVTKNGVKSHFVYDSHGRVGSTEVLSPSGNLLNIFRYTYDGDKLGSIQDDSGLKVTHEYLESGAIGATIQSSGSGSRKKGFVYDEVGHLEGVKEWFGPDEEQFSLTTTIRNKEEKIERINVLDAFGNLLKEEQGCLPEDRGNLSSGTITNSLGQTVARKIVYGSAGDITETVYNALSRPETISKWDDGGYHICEEKIFYDLNGNKTRHVFFAYDKGKMTRHYELAWEYGPMNRLEAVIEEGNKRSICEYNAAGKRVGLIKPDGVRINYFYDDLGRLASISSSDETIGYSYTYDAYDRLIEAKDTLCSVTTNREYTAFNELTKERLANGLVIEKNYDGKGRNIGVLLPDGSTIRYDYDAAYLRDVVRVDATGKELYKHSFKNYSSDGQLIEARLIGDLGCIQLKNDAQKRCVGITTPFWSQKIPEEGFDFKGDLISYSVQDPIGSYTQEFRYDSQQQIVAEEGLSAHQYTYDAIYNRRMKDENACEINLLNQVIAFNGVYYTYDANGNRVAKVSNQERVRY